MMTQIWGRFCKKVNLEKGKYRPKNGTIRIVRGKIHEPRQLALVGAKY